MVIKPEQLPLGGDEWGKSEPASEHENQEREILESEEESEVSRLFASVLAETTEGMDKEQAAAFLTEVLEGGELETEHLFEHLANETSPNLQITSYQPDTAVREASLAPKKHWKTALGGELMYTASNELEVYLSRLGEPLEVGEALNHIRKLNENTVLTARIALGLWNSRRASKQLAKNGSVPVLLEEILQWQGHEKHTRLAYPETDSPKRYTDGYRSEQKKRVMQDMALLQHCHVRGTCEIAAGGKVTTVEVDGPYLHYDTVSRKTRTGEKVVIGFLVNPGGWITTYEQQQAESLAQIDRQIFTLNPQNDRYALRLALYLTERWRGQAKAGTFSTPILMSDLLASSMIEVDKRHLTAEMAPRIEAALQRLEDMNIIGKQLCLNPPNKEKARWGKDWLAARWEILPPAELIRSYRRLPGRKRQSTLPRPEKKDISRL
ncbi:MAG TPA: hypothetical protein VFV38_33990 [Ktedonobacteraceae bacterium]|nr:hypothetical protein [Ktedonobacteraceae bacterium]